MVGNTFYKNKTAKIDGNFKNTSFNMLASCSFGEICGCIQVSMHYFYYF